MGQVSDSFFESMIEILNNGSLMKKVEKIQNQSFGKSSLAREEAIQRIRSDYFTDDNLVLVLGAGVSFEYGIPTWPQLVQSLMMGTLALDDSDADAIASLFGVVFNPNALITGRYLETFYSKSSSLRFEERVREVLYRNFEPKVQSKLMSQIVHLCLALGKGTPSLNAIISYNFDDLVEESLEAVNGDFPYKCIYSSSQDKVARELPIYHVHGFLPRKGRLDSSNKITLGEGIYHQHYTEVYSWSNIVQLMKYRERPCVFIGTSLNDPNTRRLLDVAFKQKADTTVFQHYIIRKTTTEGEIEEVMHKIPEELISGGVKDQYTGLLKGLYEHFLEQDAASLGVNTIWIDDYSEIAGILSEIPLRSR